MASRPEMSVDHTVRRKEPLRLGWRLEPLHLPFSPPCRPVGILSTIIQVATCPVPHIRNDGALRSAVAAQAVGDQTPRLISKSSQQSLEEALCGSGIPAVLDQNVELDAIL